MSIEVTGRKREVLIRLLEAGEDWVGGPELANRRCGGSEGHRRSRAYRVSGTRNIFLVCLRKCF